uniref:Uncharacterized protein n=1 Tax=Arundo donax TaxID=35708 RepID=A0A0A9FJP3_ARUDO
MQDFTVHEGGELPHESRLVYLEYSFFPLHSGKSLFDRSFGSSVTCSHNIMLPHSLLVVRLG